MIFLAKKDAEKIAAFFRQADLSLDRSRWNLWQELLAYYEKKQIPLEFNIIEKHNKNNLSNAKMTKKLVLKILKKFLLLLTNKYVMLDCESKYLEYVKNKFILNIKNNKNYNYDAEKLRVMSAEVYRFMFKNVLNEKLNSVNHFMQTDETKTMYKL